ncbi:RNA 2',3'-cyclic phosphodiesterase [Blastopirellula marina]|uniref:RNA 2',3'-cyclic phosphodiesterase n=1 Tax=Blastopirellula marina TaxID=124 RepID=A0A2S8GHD9_9BACT|nr:RNA 2',3'-cyclic phosphodiesterase [Blastopirellula marina]PQO43876.1 RNA 2',3'-cyclic phosphodiesterase [Blastopirellula marina]
MRYFIAIPLPDDARERLLDARPVFVDGMRLIERQELHLTLHFLGELTALSRQTVCSALEEVTMSSFAIAIRGVGTFPPDGPPNVLWSGVEGGSELPVLHHAVGKALEDAIGFQIERRPYTPHITLARFNGPAPPTFVEEYLSQNRGLNIQGIPIRRFALYSSKFVDGVPWYEEEAVFELS